MIQNLLLCASSHAFCSKYFSLVQERGLSVHYSAADGVAIESLGASGLCAMQAGQHIRKGAGLRAKDPSFQSSFSKPHPTLDLEQY